MKPTSRILSVLLLSSLVFLLPSLSEGLGLRAESPRTPGLFPAGDVGPSLFSVPAGGPHRPTLFAEKAETGTTQKSGGGVRHKSPGTALILSLILPGAGQWYNGQIGKGFGFLGMEMVGWGVMVWGVVSGVEDVFDDFNNINNINDLTVSKKSMGKAYAGLGIMTVAVVWSCVDAFKTAKKINDGRALFQNPKTGRSVNVTMEPMVRPTGEFGGQLALRATF